MQQVLKNKKVALLGLALVVAMGVWFNNSLKTESAVPDVVSEYNKEISNERMLETIQLLSNPATPRIAGLESEEQAAVYLEEAFEDLGLTVTAQSFPVEAYKNNSYQIKIVGPDSIPLQEPRLLGFSGVTSSAGVTAKVVSVGLGSEADFEQVDVKDKIALIKRGGELFRTKVSRAAENGAVGAVFYDPEGSAAISATLGTLAEIPAVCIHKEDALWIEQQLLAEKEVKVSLSVDSVSKMSTSQNVIGLIKAPQNESGKYLVIGAHYDGVDTAGANDNASGAAAILETARILAAHKDLLKYDIKVVAFGAEEIGLIGSRHFVEKLTYDELDQALAMINLDMVGVGNVLTLASPNEGKSESMETLAVSVSEALSLEYETGRSDHSDHVPFASAGIPTIFISNSPYSDYHTSKDVYEAIDQEAMNRSCQFSIALAMTIATQEKTDLR